jgi:hypothetical protein
MGANLPMASTSYAPARPPRSVGPPRPSLEPLGDRLVVWYGLSMDYPHGYMDYLWIMIIYGLMINYNVPTYWFLPRPLKHTSLPTKTAFFGCRGRRSRRIRRIRRQREVWLGKPWFSPKLLGFTWVGKSFHIGKPIGKHKIDDCTFYKIHIHSFEMKKDLHVEHPST